MATLEENAARGLPTGIPDDAVEAAHAINAEIGRWVNLPGRTGHVGVVLAGIASGKAADLAQVSIALSLADIAASLRKLSGRENA